MDNNQNITRQKIYLAALLHDIGKFYERTGLRDYKQNNIFNYSHAVYSRAFYDDYPNVKKIIDKFELENANGDYNLINIGAKHHAPSSDLEKIIHYADRFSAAGDRYSNKEEAEIVPKGKYERPLLSIFSRIQINDNPKKSDFLYHKANELNINENIFPDDGQINNENSYKELWGNFIEEFIELGKTEKIEYFNENLLKLLERYTAKITSSATNEEIPDITLFDHSKTTAAFAVAMYNYLLENDNKPEFNKNTGIVDKLFNRNIKPFILVGGDLSGIQNFIYDIKGKGAAKNLKGRSFYLHILTKTFISKLLKKLDLKKANLIYGTGGTFYFVAQNTEKAIQIIKDLTLQINKALYDIFGVKIYFALNHIAFGREELDDKKIGCIWDELISKRIEEKKNLKYLDFIEDLIKPQEIISNKKDAVTGDLLKNYITKPSEDGEIKLINNDLNGLGKKLRKTDYWIISEEPIKKYGEKFLFNPFDTNYLQKDSKNNENFNELSLFHYFLPKEELKSIADAEIIQFNNTDFIIPNNWDNILGFEFYGGNKFPLNENNEVKEFSELAQGVDFDRLGVLRMDVDSLGKIFAKGFDFSKKDICKEKNEKNEVEKEKNEISFSRLATLSRSLDLFFSGYLNKIWEREKYKEQTMIIYSGGDDLFIVGRWDLLIDMAYDIRSEFKKYTGNNPNLSLSGGIAIVKPKFPILKAAKLSGELESKAKAKKINFYQKNIKPEIFDNKNYYKEKADVIEKNSFYFLGNNLNWDVEIDFVRDLKEKIFEYLTWEGKEKLPKAFIQRIIWLNNYRIETEDKFEKQNWIWKSLYYLKRLKARHLKLEKFITGTAENIRKYNNEYSNIKPDLVEFYNDLSESVLKGKKYEIPAYINKEYFAENSIHFMDMLALACRWAFLQKKTIENNN